jgi:hypothetical protein
VGTTEAAYRLAPPKDATIISAPGLSGPGSQQQAARTASLGVAGGLAATPSHSSQSGGHYNRRSGLMLSDGEPSLGGLFPRPPGTASGPPPVLSYSCPGLSSLELSPPKGRLGPGEVAEVEVTLVASHAGVTTTEVLVEVRGGGLLKLPLKVTAVAPRVEVSRLSEAVRGACARLVFPSAMLLISEVTSSARQLTKPPTTADSLPQIPRQLPLRATFVGSTRKAPLTLANVTPVKALLVCDLTQHPELQLALAPDAWSQADYEACPLQAISALGFGAGLLGSRAASKAASKAGSRAGSRRASRGTSSNFARGFFDQPMGTRCVAQWRTACAAAALCCCRHCCQHTGHTGRGPLHAGT